MGRRWSGMVIGLILLASSCSQPTSVEDRTVPEFRVSSDDAQIVLPANSYCVPGQCATGGPPDPLPSVGAAKSLVVAVSKPDWTVTASLHKSGAPCQRKYSVALTRLDASRWQLAPAGPADGYEVRLWSEGPGGSADAAFLWTTTVDVPRTAEPC